MYTRARAYTRVELARGALPWRFFSNLCERILATRASGCSESYGESRPPTAPRLDILVRFPQRGLPRFSSALRRRDGGLKKLSGAIPLRLNLLGARS